MEPREPDGELQIAGVGPGDSEFAAVAALEQQFTGLRIGLPTLTAQCCCCGT